MKLRLIHLMIAMLVTAATCHAAEAPRITPEAARITDQTISSDIAAINGLQKRLADVNTLGTPIGTYHFAKAQAWIDMAMDQYTMNDRTQVIEDTVSQAHQLIVQLEAKSSNISMDTPLLPTSRKIRADLWQKAADWKKHPGFPCGEDLVAQLEVQLVWAGHEDNQLGWRHAKPYLQAAERYAKEAGRKIESCSTQLAADKTTTVISMTVEGDQEDEQAVCEETPAECPACPACPPQTPAMVAADSAKAAAGQPEAATGDGLTLPDRIHFALNRDIISARSAAVLERVATVLRANGSVNVELRGHADERGNELFNRILSRQRAEVVRTYLVAAGIKRSRITVKAFGKAIPFMRGSDILSFARNRRVELSFSGADGIRPLQQFEDLQVEKRQR
ncbi:MAG: OmpA family protein [Deltaproteobacteria bacterium]|nr:OmpA family protein [Deltaproteobacteria bacterium]